jgi:hypothetical protein
MVQPNYSPQEALERVKLMMKYDTSKTLNENKQSINEVVPLVIPAITIAAPWLYATGAAGVAAIGSWIYNVQGGGDSFKKTKDFFAGCSTNMKSLKPTVDKSTYRGAADSIYNAIEGFGTTLPSIKSALDSMPTVADLCALNSWYTTQYGDLYDDLDSDIDGTDFTKYVWSAIAPKIADAEDDLTKTKEDGNKTDGTKTPNVNPVKTPPELKDVKAFQDWLDVNAKGWATGYKDGIINKGQNGKGYGFYGPRTQKAWATYKDQYLKGDTAAETPAAPVTKPDEIEQVDAEDSTDLLK